MSSNWDNGSSISGAPEEHAEEQYRLDCEGLQIGIGSIGLELLGTVSVPLMMGISQQRLSTNVGSRCIPTENGQGQDVLFGLSRHNHNGCQEKFKDVEVQLTVDGIPIRNVYITNINAEVGLQDILNIFRCYGQVMNFYMGISKNNSSKKFAFVTFENPMDAARVLKVKRFQDRRGRFIYANPADSWHQPKEGPNGKVLWHRHPKSRENVENAEVESEQQSQSDSDTSILETLPEVEGLNVLNDDCLMHIFSYLTYREITGVERVCKRWQALSFTIWKCLRELVFHDPRFHDLETTAAALEQYLVRCGDRLTTLDLIAKSHSFNETTLVVVAKYCANLEVLRVGHINVGNRSLAHLGRSCPKLKQLIIEACHNYKDQDLMSLFPKCRELNVLKIAQNTDMTGKCLPSLEGPLTSLTLSYCPSVKMVAIIAGLQKVKNTLERLSLNQLVHVTKSDVQNLVKTVPNVTHLKLNRWLRPPGDPRTLDPIANLKNLVSLELVQNVAVNDALMLAIVNGCENLTSLSVRCCSESLTRTGIQSLARLRRLIHLDISYLYATDGEALKVLFARNSKLKRLLCRGCPDLTKDGCIQALIMCNDLELFDLSGCDNVTDEVVESAVTSVKMRTNNVPLKLIIGGTSVEWVGIGEDAPLLTVDPSDLSEEHLKPDFMESMFFGLDDDDDMADDSGDDFENLSAIFGGFGDDVAEFLLPYDQYKLMQLGCEDFFDNFGGDTESDCDTLPSD